MTKQKFFRVLMVVMVVVSLCVVAASAADFGSEDYQSNLYATGWALLPPVIAIALALITKEVYSSLFVGILAGALMYGNFNLENTYYGLVNTGFIGSIADAGNVGILIFLVTLGAIVILINRAGGSAAYGAWASKKIKSRTGALLATTALGCLIFVDDYFNCLTVGSVMRPVTDKQNVSRAKLAYIIDATAAPVCMIAPVSSWAAAVAGVVEGYNGIELFIKAIPYNFYSLLTIVMMIVIAVLKVDFGPMKVHEDNAANGDIYTTPDRPYANAEVEDYNPKGKVIDLILPIIVLIVLCIVGMLYTGGFFEGVDLITAFGDCDATLGLPLGSILALIFMIIYYMCRKILTFKQCMEALPEGFKSMVPAILILTFAWTLCTMTSLLGADVFVEHLLADAGTLQLFLPAVIFLIACGLSFATGTSWGTFGILIPIVVNAGFEGELLVIAVSACLAGAVCGDHCSPISDTTIMASTGAQCNHLNHVSTQLPYALLVAGVSAVGYILAAFVQNWLIVLPIMVVVMALVLVLIGKLAKKKA